MRCTPGMGVSPVPLSLLLTLEPEAAALAIASTQQKPPAAATTSEEEAAAALKLQSAQGTSTTRPAKARLSPEDVVLVLDCGGGTVDLTLARVYGTGRRTRLEEEAVGRGGPRGLAAAGRFRLLGCVLRVARLLCWPSSEADIPAA